MALQVLKQPEMTWEGIVEAHYEEIFRFAVHFFGSRAEGEDTTQEIFIKAWQRIDQLKDQEKLRPWLYTIARRECIDRSRWWKRVLMRSEELSPELSSGKPLSDNAIAASRTIAALPLKQKEVFVLRHLHGFSTEETGEILNISPGTVKSHLKRAMDKISASLLEQ